MNLNRPGPGRHTNLGSAPSRGAVGRLSSSLDRIRTHTDSRRDEPIFQADPELREQLLGHLERLITYFRPEVRGYQNLSVESPMLLVGNHSGGMAMPDTYIFGTSWLKVVGDRLPLHGLVHDLLLSSPMARHFRALGAVPASRENAEKVLDSKSALVVYPGGDHDAFRPWSQRNRIDFDGRKGFIRLALRKQVPVMPLVSHGGHHTLRVATRGETMAKALGLHKIRVKCFPFKWALPWGLVPGWVPSLPLPARIIVEIGKPLDWTHYGPDAADDPKIVDRCYEEIVSVMQASLTSLAEEVPRPLLSGWGRQTRSKDVWFPGCEKALCDFASNNIQEPAKPAKSSRPAPVGISAWPIHTPPESRNIPLSTPRRRPVPAMID